MRRRLLLAPSRLPCTPPPFGALVAIDLRTGQRQWEVPLGSMTTIVAPDVAPQTKPDWGSINLGGAAAAASGVVFIGATVYDKKFRAFDAKTGKVLWEMTLPAAGNATPAVYDVNGKEFVVIGAGGGTWGAASGGSYVAFALP